MLQNYKMSPFYASKAQDGPFEFRVYAMYTVQEKKFTGNMSSIWR